MGRSSRQIHQRQSLSILQSFARSPLHQTRWSFSFSVFHRSEDYFGWAWRSSPNTLLFLHRPLHVWFGQSCSELQAYGICFVFSQGFERQLSKYLHSNPPSWSSSKHHPCLFLDCITRSCLAFALHRYSIVLYANNPNNTGCGRGRAQNKGSRLCTHCNKTNHTVETCYSNMVSPMDIAPRTINLP